MLDYLSQEDDCAYFLSAIDEEMALRRQSRMLREAGYVRINRPGEELDFGDVEDNLNYAPILTPYDIDMLTTRDFL